MATKRLIAPGKKSSKPTKSNAVAKRGRPKAKAKPIKVIRDLIDWDSPLYISEINAATFGDTYGENEESILNKIVIHRPFLTDTDYPVVATIIGDKDKAITSTITARFSHTGVSEEIAALESAVITINNRTEKYAGYAVVFCVHASSRSDGPMKLVVASDTYATRDELVAAIPTIFSPICDHEDDDKPTEEYDIPGVQDFQSLNDIYAAISKVNVEVQPHRTGPINYDDDDDDGGEHD